MLRNEMNILISGTYPLHGIPFAIICSNLAQCMCCIDTYCIEETGMYRNDICCVVHAHCRKKLQVV